MYDYLPNEIIQYILSFDDNLYFKKKFNQVITQINNLYSKKLLIMYISNFKYFHEIHVAYSYFSVKNTITISKYILIHNKWYGMEIIFQKVLLPSQIKISNHNC